MLRRAILLFSCIVLCVVFVYTIATPAWSAPLIQTETQAPRTGTVNTGANLRAGPGTNFARVGSAMVGQTVTIVDQNAAGTWYQLEGGQWIAASLVDVSDAAPVAATATITTAAGIETSQPVTTTATANRDANLRGGPGTTFPVVGSVRTGQVLTIAGQNAAGTWYQLAGGKWIAAFLVDRAQSSTPVTPTTSTETTTEGQASPTATATPTPAPSPTPTPAGSAVVVIQSVAYDGAVYRVESDEYAVIANTGTAAINLGGWRLNAGDGGQDFVFPGFDLGPGQSVRVYTNEHHAESGGFSFGSGRAIWNNDGDCGYLYDQGGAEVDSYCY